jgi:hypothetical protein
MFLPVDNNGLSPLITSRLAVFLYVFWNWLYSCDLHLYSFYGADLPMFLAVDSSFSGAQSSLLSLRS